MMFAPLALNGLFMAILPFAGVQVVNVSINGKCDHDMDARKTVRKKDRDVLVWRIENDCPAAQKVLICVNPEPPLVCTGDPDTVKIRSQFEMDAATNGKVRAAIVCTVKWPHQKEDYKVDLSTGPASGADLRCPITTTDHELALEVVP